MKDIFANLYNKVVSFFHQTENNEDNAKDVACNRLKLVLMQDRTNLSPAIMDRMRKELIDLLSKYVELDRELLDLNFEQEDSQMALMLSIPVVRAKSEDEILAVLEEEDEETSETETEDEETDSEEDEKSSEDEETSETETEDEETDSEEDEKSSEEEETSEEESEEQEENSDETEETEKVEEETETKKEDKKSSKK